VIKYQELKILKIQEQIKRNYDKSLFASPPGPLSDWRGGQGVSSFVNLRIHE
jgi:hypothetical protein